jgi:cysteinyl-tRNA synthetase
LAGVRPVRLHDTASGALRELRPRDGRRVGLYACGPTVYGRIHVGNARPFVTFALLARFLRREGYEVTLVANVTDVNDKIYDAAARADPPVASAALAREMTAAYVADTDGLGLGRPDHEPLASETIERIVELIDELIERGHAYAVQGDVYFRVHSDPRYGWLSHRELDAMDQGEGLEGTQRKEHPLDFALWKAHKEGEDTAWDAPWGRGRPGWHIECSAMAEELLGLEFEIHGGGSDLVFPHHENEAAQTRCARGRELADIWMHNGMLQLGRDKMAKSIGNVAPLHAVLGRWGRDALIMFFAGAHYRQPVEFDDRALEEARARVERVRDAGRRLAGGDSPADMARHRDAFLDALADDFNTAAALGHLFEWVREANRRGEGVGRSHLAQMLDVLALEGLLDALGREPGAEDHALLERRQAARAARDFAAADALRDELRERGWEVRDGPDGATLVPVQ